jgi:predicted nucleic acid-binding protein
MFLLDTCVLSESMKPEQHAAVIGWLSLQPRHRLYISAITIGELHFGAERLSEGKRQRQLKAWIETVEEDFAGNIVPLDQRIGALWGQLRAKLVNPKIVDTQIAATALTYGFTLVTRNTRDFAIEGLNLIDPWKG